MSHTSGASSSSLPCAACKFLRRKCTAECVFALYFPADQPLKFYYVHRIFGVSNVSKILHDLPESSFIGFRESDFVGFRGRGENEGSGIRMFGGHFVDAEQNYGVARRSCGTAVETKLFRG
ncbi:hypothetical protein MPTK1_5g17835 [Marchantia polymorpha subsp. ruderalis]